MSPPSKHQHSYDDNRDYASGDDTLGILHYVQNDGGEKGPAWLLFPKELR